MKRNVITFESRKARAVRILFHGRIDTHLPGIDELEIYGPKAIDRNIALAQYGVRVRVPSTLDVAPHRAAATLSQDGRFGDDSAWVASPGHSCYLRRGRWMNSEMKTSP